MRHTRRRNRKGNIIVLSTVGVVVMMIMTAFALDLGVLEVARTEAQASADSAALAAAAEYVSDERIKGSTEENLVFDSARGKAVEYAGFNDVRLESPYVDTNDANSVDGDVVIGRLDNPSDLTEQMVYDDPSSYNSVTVRINRTAARNSSVALFFARVLGVNAGDVTAEATAIFDDNIIGFSATNATGNSGLLPFVVHEDYWQDILDGIGNDDWTYDSSSQTLAAGADGIVELNMFPGSGSNTGNGNSGNGSNAVTPGNFGTIDIGTSGNSTDHLRDLIDYGPTPEDFEYHGGQLALDPVSKTLDMTGDTGMSVGMSAALDNVIGQPRTIFLYSQVAENGNNSVFTVTGFSGVRIVDHDLTGNDKYIRIQPAYVMDPTAVSGDYGNSSFVGQPIHLVR